MSLLLVWVCWVAGVARADDATAITRHLERIEETLRAEPAPAARLEGVRAALLDVLHAYWQAEVYPRNPGLSPHPRRVLQAAMFDGGPDAVPIFIDAGGRPCAVARLVLASGARALAARVVAEANTSFLHDMHVAGLAEWVAASGFTLDELAAIQPTYRPSSPWPRAATCEIEDLEKERHEHDGMGGRVELPASYQRCLALAIQDEKEPRRLVRMVKFLGSLALPASGRAVWEVTLLARLTPPSWELRSVAFSYLAALDAKPGRRADATALVTLLTPLMEERMSGDLARHNRGELRNWCGLRRPDCWGGGEDRPADCQDHQSRCLSEFAGRTDAVSNVPVPPPPRPPDPPVAPTPAPQSDVDNLPTRAAKLSPWLAVGLVGAIGALVRVRRRRGADSL